MGQLSDKDFSVFQEKMFRFPGFYVQKRSIREYTGPYAAHVLGDVGEVSESDIEDDSYYQPGDYIGKLGVEKYYEKELRGEKGIKSNFVMRTDEYREVTSVASSISVLWQAKTLLWAST